MPRVYFFVKPPQLAKQRHANISFLYFKHFKCISKTLFGNNYLFMNKDQYGYLLIIYIKQQIKKRK